METTIHERSRVEREMEIKIAEPELTTALDDAYKKVRPRLSLPGFRLGKAPLGLVKKMYGDSIEGDALEKMAQEKFQEVIKGKEIVPIGTPVMTEVHRHPGEGAHFKIAYEIAPEINLVDFSGLEVEKTIVPISEEDVEDRISRIRFSRAERTPTDSVDDEQTVVSLAMEDTRHETGKEPAKSEGVEIYVADPEILPAIRENVIGKKVGDTFEVQLPRNPKSEVEGEQKEMSLVKMTVVSAHKVVLPALDEEFLDKITRGKLKTESELRDDLKTQLEKASKQRSEEQLEESIVAQILQRHDFDVPRSIVHLILDQMLEERRAENAHRGYPPNFGLDENEFRTHFWSIAEARGKWILLREKLIESEGLAATDEDLEALAEKEAAEYGLTKDNLMLYYQRDETVKNRIVSEKLSKLLREKVKVVEKTMERKPRT